MNDHNVVPAELYIGAVVEHESERSTLLEIERLLANDGKQAIAFANFEIESRQIDLLVATDSVALVIEAKGYSRPIRGGENGDWQVQLASGRWKDFRNPYRQALGATLEVKNAAARFAGTNAPYIDAALVFAPGVPPRSQAFEGNRKVSVMGHEGLAAALDKRRPRSWPIAQWRQFARHLGLKPTTSVAAACDAGLAEAEDRLRHYRAMFVRTYADGETLVPFECRSAEATLSSGEVANLVLTRRGGFLLKGPSGCGKSMLAAASGAMFSKRGGVAVSVEGKDFVGGFKTLLNRETGLLGARSAIQVLGDARRLGRPILFVVDGYNECSEGLRKRFTRGIAALAGRYEAGVLIASQIDPVRRDLLELQDINVPRPTKETKRRIAEAVSGERAQSLAIRDLLDAVSSGLEARLVGEVGGAATPGSARYALFDAFARVRLGGAAGKGIRVLSQLAAWLCERFAFSISIREFDRFMDSGDVSSEFRTLLVDRGLLTRRGDRVSFPHEMFLDAFAAEAVVRHAAGQTASMLKALSAPVHVGRKDLIIGAVDDDAALERLLPGLDDQASIRACLQGRCGSGAREWAEEHCRQLWIRLREEASRVRFQVNCRGYFNAAFEASSLKNWSPCDRAFLSLLPERIAGGHHLECAFEAVGALDRRMAEDLPRLGGQTGMAANRLGESLFAASYVLVQPSLAVPGISGICGELDSGAFSAPGQIPEQSETPRAGNVCQELLRRKLSPGQIYLFLNLFRWGGVPASFISGTVETMWEDAPYHLQLKLMEAAASCGVLDAVAAGTANHHADRAALIQTIRGVLPGCIGSVASSAVEALQALGALDEEADRHLPAIRTHARNCVAEPADRERQAEAYAIYSAQFEHPYADAYFEVIAELPRHDRKTLLKMAALGADVSALFVDTLLHDLVAFDDPDVGEILGRWTSPPPRNGRNMPQSDIRCFVTAHVGLARLGCPLPTHAAATENSPVRALTCCGAILYWANRDDLDKRTRANACDRAFRILRRTGVALDVLRECEEALRLDRELRRGEGPVVRSLVNQFPEETVAVGRAALQNPEAQTAYFLHHSHFDQERIIAFGIEILEAHGNKSDAPLLRRYASSSQHGSHAISALKGIEIRSNKTSEDTA